MILVNGEPLDAGLVGEAFNRIKGEAEAKLKVSCCERDDEFYAQAEDEVIDSVLIAQDVEKRYAVIPEEKIAPRLEQIFRKYREAGATWEMLEKERSSLREEISADLRMIQFMDDLVGGEGEIDEETLLDYYEDHKVDFAQTPRAKCLHICFFPQNHEDLPALVRHVRMVRQQALGGADFEKLALEFTEKENKEIVIDWVDLEDAMHPFEALLFSMDQGEISPALSYDQALHLLKVTEAVEAKVPSFDEIKDKVRDRYLIDLKRERLSERAMELRAVAKIEKKKSTDLAESGLATG